METILIGIAFTLVTCTDCKSALSGELVIRDLGYVSIENIRTLSEQRGAYYLNRLNTTTNAFYEKNGQRINFTRIETWMRKQGLERYEIKVKIGTKKKLLTIMIITLVPEVIKENRKKSN